MFSVYNFFDYIFLRIEPKNFVQNCLVDYKQEFNPVESYQQQLPATLQFELDSVAIYL